MLMVDSTLQSVLPHPPTPARLRVSQAYGLDADPARATASSSMAAWPS